MSKYQWHRDIWSPAGCPGTYLDPGWYMGDKFIVKDYKNPATGKPYTAKELDAIQGLVGSANQPKKISIAWVIGITLVIIAGIVWLILK